MGTIYYDFTVGETVWIIHDYTVTECEVIKVCLEIDPTSDGNIQDEVSYHLDTIETWGEIFVKDQTGVYGSLQDAMNFIAEETIPTPDNTYNVAYEHDVGDNIWVYHDEKVINGDITQISINIIDETIIWYHILPDDTDYSTLIKLSDVIFLSQEGGLLYMESLE